MDEKTITAVITAHGSWTEVQKAVIGMIQQTRKPNKIIVYFSGIAEDIEGEHKGIQYVRCEDKKDWGHDKRAQGLEECDTDYLVFVNADDDYDQQFIQEFMDCAEETDGDFIYGNFRSHLFKGSEINAGLACGRITSGCYIVKTSKAKEAGYNSRRYEADWDFIKGVIDISESVFKIEGCYYTHL